MATPAAINLNQQVSPVHHSQMMIFGSFDFELAKRQQFNKSRGISVLTQFENRETISALNRLEEQSTSNNILHLDPEQGMIINLPISKEANTQDLFLKT